MGNPKRISHHWLFVAAAASLAAHAAAFREYMRNLPNAGVVPCVNNEVGCAGRAYCEAFGHEDCLAAADELPFGEAFHKGAGGGSKNRWTLSLCAADTDGDGFTNGDELGDPCCSWQAGTEAPVTHDISDPGRANSAPRTRTTCSSVSSLATPTLLSSTADARTLVLEWADASSCSCEYTVAIATATSTTVRAAPADRKFTLCDVDVASITSISIASLNRAGASSALVIPSPASTAGAFPSAADAAAAAASCTPVWTSPHWMNSGGTVVLSSPVIPAVGPIIGAIVLGLLVVVAGWMLNQRASDPSSTWRNTLIHSVCCRGALRARKTPPHWLWEALAISPAALILIAACVFGIVLSYFLSAAYWNAQVYAFNQKLSVSRGLGFATAVSLGLQLFPTTRYSLWLYFTGTSFERALRLHRWVSMATVALVIAHTVIMAVGFCNSSSLGCAHLVAWRADDEVNPLAGVISGGIMALIAAVALLRRWKYGLTQIVHYTWPAVLLFAVLHTRHSKGGALGVLLPGFVLLVLDKLVLVADAFLRPVTVMRVRLAHTTVPDSASHTSNVVIVTARKCGRWQWVQSLWPFVYSPGQYVNVIIPSISLLPHPISISSLCSPTDAGTFTLHVKSMGHGTWSNKLVQHVVRMSEAPADPASSRPQFTVSSNLTMMATGPFGKPTLQLEEYAHFILVAGGIGITPLAPLHMALATGAPVTAEPPLPWFACTKRRAAHVQSVTMLWNLRDAGLLREFAPQLWCECRVACGTPATAFERVMAALKTNGLPAHGFCLDAQVGVHGGAAEVECERGQSQVLVVSPATRSVGARSSEPSDTGARSTSADSTDSGTQLPVVTAGSLAARTVRVSVHLSPGSNNLLAVHTPKPGHHEVTAESLGVASPSGQQYDSAGGPFLRVSNYERMKIAAALTRTARQILDAAKASGAPPSSAKRTAVAVCVCGPHDMIVDVVRECAAFNASDMGKQLVFHAHAETFLM